MNYETAETEIADKLKTNATLISIADVFVLPDDVADYKTPTIKGLVTTVFLGEKFDSNQSIGQASQHSTVTFNISVQARKMRGSKGIYVIAEEVKKTLEGFAPSDCGILTLSEHDFSGYQNDVWEHSLTFSCRSLRVQEYPNSLPDDPVTDDEVYYQPGESTMNMDIDFIALAFSKGFNTAFQA